MAEVSIIIPAYNQALYLKETLDSVRAQTYKDYECIIVDDGSTDDTFAVASKYCSDNRIKYYYQTNKGLACARNKGIILSKGKYLHFLDSDDLIYPNFLEEMIRSFKENFKVDILISAWIYIDEKGTKISRKIGPVRSRNYFEDLLLQNLFPIHAAVVNRKLFDKVGLFNEKLKALEDWNLWLRAAEAGFCFEVKDIIGAIYRRHANCMTLDIGRMINNLSNFIDIAVEQISGFREYKRYTKIFQLLKIYLYSEEANNSKYLNEILEDIKILFNETEYNHYFFKKIYEIIRKIRNIDVQAVLCKNVFDIVPQEFRNFWGRKLFIIKLKKALKKIER